MYVLLTVVWKFLISNLTVCVLASELTIGDGQPTCEIVHMTQSPVYRGKNIHCMPDVCLATLVRIAPQQ